jgi:hypothetical protein
VLRRREGSAADQSMHNLIAHITQFESLFTELGRDERI